MSLFNQIGKQQGPSFQQFQQNPIHYLRQAGLNIPDGMTDPNQIQAYLMQSRQLPQARYQQAIQVMQRLMGK